MDLGIADHVFVVTGASAGLGLATARVLASEGARLVIAARDQERVTAAAASLDAGGSVIGMAADLGSPATADTLVGAALERFGRLDGCVISVGGPTPGSASEIRDEEWRTAFETLFLGSLRLARATLAVEPVAGTSVTFVLSTSVRTPLQNLAISNGLRPGLAMVAKSLADEFGPSGARVNAVLPGRFDTDRVRSMDDATGRPVEARREMEATIPLRRYGRPEEFGRAAAFLASPAASYFTGTTLTVDGGLTRTL